MATLSNGTDGGHRPGPLGRLGVWSYRHLGAVSVGWILVTLLLGGLVPQVTAALSGAGWQADGSASVRVRELAQQHFHGDGSSALQVVVFTRGRLTDEPARQVIGKVTRLLHSDRRVSQVIPYRPGWTVSPDGRTAIILGGAKAGPQDMVRAAEELKGPLRKLSTKDVTVRLTGSSAVFADFNAANLDAVVKAEAISLPVLLAIMVIAFGSLVAAGLPLLLTLAGLVTAAGSLVLITKLTPVSIWALGFAMVFALALGVDYALLLVTRFRTVLARDGDRSRAIAETMDTAGRSVLLSGLTVLVSLPAVTLVPVPVAASVAVGVVLATAFVLTAALTLLPGVLAALGPRVNGLALPWARTGRQSSLRLAGWGERLWRRPLRFGALGLAIVIALSVPLTGLRTAMPSIAVVPAADDSRQGLELLQRAFGPGAAATIQIIAPAKAAPVVADRLRGQLNSARIAAVSPPEPATDGSGLVLIRAVPWVGPSDPSLPGTVSRLRLDLRGQALVGGVAVDSIDLAAALRDRSPLVIGVMLAVGLLLLLLTLRAPLITVLGAAANALGAAAAFGVARLVFQDGVAAEWLGFTSQGFLDGWAPIFFFVVIFALSSGYTIALLSSAKEHYARTGDTRAALVGGLGDSGRPILAAAGVMAVVLFSLVPSGRLPVKEMGLVIGLAVLLDVVLVRFLILPAVLRLSGHAAWWSPFAGKARPSSREATQVLRPENIVRPVLNEPVPSELVQTELVQTELVQSGSPQSERVQNEQVRSDRPRPEPVHSDSRRPEPVATGQQPRRFRWHGAGVVLGPIAGALAVVAVLGAGAFIFAAGGDTCSGPAITLEVAAAPEIQPAIADAATRLNDKRRAGGSCIRATVRAADPAQTSTLLGQGAAVGATRRPDVWIPDSSLWTALIPGAGITPGVSIAQSPIVAGVPRGLADVLRSQGMAADQLSWADLLRAAGGVTAGPVNGPSLRQGLVRLQIPDPTRTAAGLAALVIADTLGAKGPEQRVVLTSMVRTLRDHTVADVGSQFAALNADQQGRYPVIIVPEQAVYGHNQTATADPVLAVYPREGTLSLDYVYTVTSGDEQKVKAARSLQAVLQDESTRGRLRALGFRTATGPAASPAPSPAPSQTPSQTGSPRSPWLPVPAPADVRRILQNWYKLSLGIRNLSVIDASASMDQQAGPDLSRLQIAVQAAQAVVSILPDDTELGIWPTSGPPPDIRAGQADSPIGRLGTGRQQLSATLDKVRTGPGSGLYDAVLAAFRLMTKAYQPAQVNSVLVFTAGDPAGSVITLKALLDALRTEYDPGRPVQIIAIGVGDGADVKALAQIAAATHGSSYVIHTPQEVRQSVLSALARRVCAPSC